MASARVEKETAQRRVKSMQQQVRALTSEVARKAAEVEAVKRVESPRSRLRGEKLGEALARVATGETTLSRAVRAGERMQELVARASAVVAGLLGHFAVNDIPGANADSATSRGADPSTVLMPRLMALDSNIRQTLEAAARTAATSQRRKEELQECRSNLMAAEEHIAATALHVAKVERDLTSAEERVRVCC